MLKDLKTLLLTKKNTIYNLINFLYFNCHEQKKKEGKYQQQQNQQLKDQWIKKTDLTSSFMEKFIHI